MQVLKKIPFIIGLLLVFVRCTSDSIFVPIPLTLDPLVLINPIALVADSAANRLYLVNSNNTVLFADASFVVLDISNPIDPQPIAVISIPSFSGEIILDTARGFVYTPNRLSDTDSDTEDQVLRININEASPNFLQVEAFPSAANPFGAWYDGTSSLYVAATADALRYNVDNFTEFASVDLNVTTAQGRLIIGEGTRELALSPSGNFLYVTNQTDNMLILNVAEIPPPPGVADLGTGPVDFIVTGTTSTTGIATDSNFIYVTDAVPSLLRILTETGLSPIVGPPQEISVSSLQDIAIPIGAEPGEVIVDEPNQRAYVANTGSDDISIIDTFLQIELTRIPLDENLPPGVHFGDAPFAMALANIGGVNFLYVANFDSSNLTILNADTMQILASFPE